MVQTYIPSGLYWTSQKSPKKGVHHHAGESRDSRAHRDARLPACSAGANTLHLWGKKIDWCRLRDLHLAQNHADSTCFFTAADHRYRHGYPHSDLARAPGTSRSRRSGRIGRRLNTPTTCSIFPISKHFTCLAYLLLCEEGRAHVDDPISSGGRYIKVSGFGESGDCALLGESFEHAPEIALIRDGAYRVVRSLNPSYREQLNPIRAVERITWKARDGLDIQGWLLLPQGEASHALVMNIHGGPVWAWRPLWPGRTAVVLSLVRQGYAVFLPNPRGSTGRGQAFVEHVYGDMGGADAQDLLSGLDALIARGIADPKRIGVIGGSYGGFITAWLITQDRRFAAAVPASAHTNQVTEHLLSNIPHFMALLLNDTYNNPTGRYFERSSIMHAHKVKTPTLNVCGALDRCTPPEEALQFHNALLEHGVKSVLITYPQEGHGVRNLPAAIDYATRVVSWFEEHMPARTR